jgi:predicted nuclease of predicted toxin-antitoxin system
MRILLDEDLPRSAGKLLRIYGHEVLDVRDIGLRGASDPEIAEYARQCSLCLISCDTGFADVRNYPPIKYPGIIVLRLPAKATSTTISILLEEILKQPQLLSQIPGKLVIIEKGHIRLRK